MDDFTTIYSKAFEQFKNNWKTILGWCGLFAIVPAIYSFFIPVNMTLIQFAWRADVPVPASIRWTNVFVVLLCLMLPLSLAHLGLKTARNEDDESFLTVGTYGFRHPFSSLFFALIWGIIYIVLLFIFRIILFGLTMISIIFAGPSALIIVGLIGLIFAFMIFIYMSFSAFNAANDTMTGFNSPLSTARQQLNGWFIHTLVMLLPVFVVFFILMGGLSVCIFASGNNYKVAIETQLAYKSFMIQPESVPTGAKDYSRLLKYSTFTKERPEYDGDLRQYVSELAKYTVEYEQFKAKKDNIPLSEEAQIYVDTEEMGSGSAGFGFLAFLLLCLQTCLFAYGLTVMSQLYRTTIGEIDDELDKENMLARQKELSSKLIYEKPPLPSGGASDSEGDSADLLSELEPPLEEQPAKVQAESDGERPDSIDPGFELKF